MTSEMPKGPKDPEVGKTELPVDCPTPLVCYTEAENEAIAEALLDRKRVRRWGRVQTQACQGDNDQ